MPVEDTYPAMAAQFYLSGLQRQQQQPNFWRDGLPALLSGIGSVFSGIRTSNEQARLQEAQREEQVFKALLQAPQPEVRAAALTGLMEGPKKSGGVFGKLFGKWEQSPKYSEVLSLLQGPGAGSRAFTGAPGSGTPAFGGGGAGGYAGTTSPYAGTTPSQITAEQAAGDPTLSTNMLSALMQSGGRPPAVAAGALAGPAAGAGAGGGEARPPAGVAGSAATPGGSYVTGNTGSAAPQGPAGAPPPGVGNPVTEKIAQANSAWDQPVPGVKNIFGPEGYNLGPRQQRDEQALQAEFERVYGKYPANEPMQLRLLNDDQERWRKAWDEYFKKAGEQSLAANSPEGKSAAFDQTLNRIMYGAVAGDEAVLNDPALSRIAHAQMMVKNLAVSPEKAISLMEAEEAKSATIANQIESRNTLSAFQSAQLAAQAEARAARGDAAATQAALTKLMAVNQTAMDIANLENKMHQEMAKLDDERTLDTYSESARAQGVAVPKAAVAERVRREKLAIQARYQDQIQTLESTLSTLRGGAGAGTPPPSAAPALPPPALDQMGALTAPPNASPGTPIPVASAPSSPAPAPSATPTPSFGANFADVPGPRPTPGPFLSQSTGSDSAEAARNLALNPERPPAQAPVGYIPPQLKGKVHPESPDFKVLTSAQGNGGTLLDRLNSLLLKGSRPMDIVQEMQRQGVSEEMVWAAARYMGLEVRARK